MFDIGFWELLLVAVIALVVLGPERLPTALRTLTQTIRTVRATAQAVKDELSQELGTDKLQQQVQHAKTMNIDKLSPELQATVTELKAAAQALHAPLKSDPPKDNTP